MPHVFGNAHCAICGKEHSYSVTSKYGQSHVEISELVFCEDCRLRLKALLHFGSDATIIGGFEIRDGEMKKADEGDQKEAKKCRDTGRQRIFECSECGYGIMDIYISDESKYDGMPKYCPNCGAEVVE